MTPDIREKAERLLADIRANDRQPHTMTSSVDLLSQALLEAHNAGRAEMREEAANVAHHLNGWGADCGRGGHAEHIATAIRSIT